MDRSYIRDAIIRSQHCQRNWDLDQAIPAEDLDLIVLAATQCPSKQNLAFYRCHFIQNRDIIEKINKATYSMGSSSALHTNSQTLANLIIVFEEYEDLSHRPFNERNDEVVKFNMKDPATGIYIEEDRQQAIGIAAGYVNVVASLLGYSTGCCKCMDGPEVKNILGIERRPELIMGIGFKDKTRNRRIHHEGDFVFPAHKKQEISVQWWN